MSERMTPPPLPKGWRYRFAGTHSRYPLECRCGARGVRNVAAHGYCATHHSELYASFNPAAFGLHGIGILDGVMRPDHAPAFADLRCVACGATWVGVVGDRCGWCSEAYWGMLDYQKELVLKPPNLDTDNPAEMTAWAERLTRAVDAGIIFTTEAAKALKRALAA